MDEPRAWERCAHKAMTGAGRAAWAVLAGLALVLAGCAMEVDFQQPVSPPGNQDGKEPTGKAAETQKPGETCVGCRGNGNSGKDENDEKKGKSDSSPPGPRTLPQALCAYLHCLRTHQLPGDEKKSENSENGSAKKSDKEDKKSDKEENAKKDDKAPAESKREAQEKDKSNGGKTEESGKKEKDEKEKDKEKEKDEKITWYSAHAQATMVTQEHGAIHSPYRGTNSLNPNEEVATSLTGTLFLDVRLWESGMGDTSDLIFNPEIAGGRGLSNVMGIAGFPNGDITRVAAVEPTPYIARLFLRQTCALGNEMEKVEDESGQIAGYRPVDRLTFTIGKYAATDLVDDNRYSHDPRTQFLNWSLMYNGAWDYPANVRGYTYGVGIDYNRKDWTIRYGIFAEPATANGAALDPHFLKANGQVIEYEQRYTINEHPGKVRLLAYLNHAHMGNYREALAEKPIVPDITLARAYRFKYGFGLNAEQEINKDLGIFTRLGWNDGQTESWAFTEIDATAALGLLLKGRCWCRPKDTVGLAMVCNGISSAHRDYLAAGGLGFIIGDGRLNYAPEEILETFYDYEIIKGINVTADFQGVNHPAYNKERGPVAVGALRVHIEF